MLLLHQKINLGPIRLTIFFWHKRSPWSDSRTSSEVLQHVLQIKKKIKWKRHSFPNSQREGGFWGGREESSFWWIVSGKMDGVRLKQTKQKMEKDEIKWFWRFPSSLLHFWVVWNLYKTLQKITKEYFRFVKKGLPELVLFTHAQNVIGFRMIDAVSIFSCPFAFWCNAGK